MELTGGVPPDLDLVEVISSEVQLRVGGGVEVGIVQARRDERWLSPVGCIIVATPAVPLVGLERDLVILVSSNSLFKYDIYYVDDNLHFVTPYQGQNLGHGRIPTVIVMDTVFVSDGKVMILRKTTQVGFLWMRGRDAKKDLAKMTFE